jgi:hypothetical protein
VKKILHPQNYSQRDYSLNRDGIILSGIYYKPGGRTLCKQDNIPICGFNITLPMLFKWYRYINPLYDISNQSACKVISMSLILYNRLGEIIKEYIDATKNLTLRLHDVRIILRNISNPQSKGELERTRIE